MNLFFKSATDQVLNAEPYITQQNIFDLYAQGGEVVKGDSFLETCYSEKLFFSLPPQRPEKALEILDDALKYGYSLPFFKRARDLVSKSAQ